MPVVIAESSKEDKAEWPFPGFSRQLLGVSRDADLTFNHTYPEDSDFKELRSREVEIQVFIEEIKKRILPELTNEFAQSINEQYTDLKALTDDIRKSLELQAKEEYDNAYNDKIMREIFKHAVIKYPPQMVEREIDIFIDQLGNRLAQQKMDMDTYLKIRKMDAAGLRTEIKPQAEERLKRTLILLEISKLENIHVENSELESESMRTLDEIGRMLPADKTRKTMSNEFVRGVISNVGADLLVRHTWDYLQSVARGEKEAPAPEAEIAQPEQASQTAEIADKPKKKRTVKKVETNEPK